MGLVLDVPISYVLPCKYIYVQYFIMNKIYSFFNIFFLYGIDLRIIKLQYNYKSFVIDIEIYYNSVILKLFPVKVYFLGS